MKPVQQQFIHDPANGVCGDCQRAVIASLLELTIEEVPHFLEGNPDADEFFCRLQAFVNSKGYAYLTVPARTGIFFGDCVDVYHEISGPSPRGNGTYHAVVGKNGQVFFDPHPSNQGLAGTFKDWEFSYLVKI